MIHPFNLRDLAAARRIERGCFDRLWVDWVGFFERAGNHGWVFGKPARGVLLLEAHRKRDRIYSLAVDPKFHGRGIGRRLVELVQMNGRPLTLDVGERNHEAARLYRSLGFRRVGTVPGRYRTGERVLIMNWNPG